MHLKISYGFDLDALRKEFFRHSEWAIRKHTEKTDLKSNIKLGIIPYEILQATRYLQLRTNRSSE